MEKEKEAVKEGLVEESEEEVPMDSLGGKKPKRGECPIPKPVGIVGEILGFGNSSTGGKGKKPP